MIFPPIFSLILFFILDIFELVFDIFGITAPVGVFLSVFSTILYMLILLVKYGPQKTKKRLFEFKKVPRTKVFKKVMKVFGASIIPFLTTWAVWDDYKEDIQEVKEKRKSVQEEEIRLKEEAIQKELENQKINQKQEVLENENSQNAIENNQNNQETENKIRNEDSKILKMYPNGSSGDFNPISNQAIPKSEDKTDKTIFEEVGGNKTWLDIEDYNDSIINYGKKEAYAAFIEKEREKNEAKIKALEIDAKRRKMQGIKAEQDLRQELLEKSKRRYGEKAKETQRLNDQYREDTENRLAA